VQLHSVMCIKQVDFVESIRPLVLKWRSVPMFTVQAFFGNVPEIAR
jgi:hypothetical protein